MVIDYFFSSQQVQVHFQVYPCKNTYWARDKSLGAFDIEQITYAQESLVPQNNFADVQKGTVQIQVSSLPEE